jgi:hypothetical protein
VPEQAKDPDIREKPGRATRLKAFPVHKRRRRDFTIHPITGLHINKILSKPFNTRLILNKIVCNPRSEQ